MLGLDLMARCAFPLRGQQAEDHRQSGTAPVLTWAPNSTGWEGWAQLYLMLAEPWAETAHSMLSVLI